MAHDSCKDDALYVQIKEAYGRVAYTQTAHVKEYLRLDKRHKWIKLAQIFISAVSTGGFIGSVIINSDAATWVGGISATILLAINLYFKDFDMGASMSQHRKASDELWYIREQYISLLTDYPDLDEIVRKEKRDNLQSKTNEVYQKAPKIGKKSYIETQRALKNEEEQFFTSEELVFRS